MKNTNRLFRTSLNNICPNYLNDLMNPDGDFYCQTRDLQYVEKRIETVDISYQHHLPKPEVK